MSNKQKKLFILLVWSVFNAEANLNYKVSDLQTEQLNATLYVPEISEKMSAIVVLGGSGGRRNTVYPELLAEQGFVVMSLSYFNAPGLSDTLDNVPVEVVGNAFDYLQNHPQVDPKRLGILGVSRGSELAFISASVDPRVTAVVGIVPSSVAWHGQAGSNAWTLSGKAVESLTFQRQSEISFYQRASAALNQVSADKALFSFENINGPILLISAKNDHIWPSKMMANQIVAYLKKRDFKFSVQHLSVEDNHFIGSASINGFKQKLVVHFKSMKTSRDLP